MQSFVSDNLGFSLPRNSETFSCPLRNRKIPPPILQLPFEGCQEIFPTDLWKGRCYSPRKKELIIAGIDLSTSIRWILPYYVQGLNGIFKTWKEEHGESVIKLFGVNGLLHEAPGPLRMSALRDMSVEEVKNNVRGGTHLYEFLLTAIQYAKAELARKPKRVVIWLLTDGEPRGDAPAVYDAVPDWIGEAKHTHGIQFRVHCFTQRVIETRMLAFRDHALLKEGEEFFASFYDGESGSQAHLNSLSESMRSATTFL